MSDVASVNSVRAQIKRGIERMGPVESGYSEVQKEWLAIMRDRLVSRIEQRRERIALAIVTASPGAVIDADPLIANIRAVEKILDYMESN